MGRITDGKLDELISLLNELKTDLNALRTDFLRHDHHSTYAQGVLVFRTSACSVSSGAATATAVAASPPAAASDFYKF